MRVRVRVQLVDHPFIKPSSIHSQEVLDAHSKDYLYLSCVKFVKQVAGGRGLRACFGRCVRLPL